MTYGYIGKLVCVVILAWLTQGEFNPLLTADHIYEVFPTRKIYKMNFKWNCGGWDVESNKKKCEENGIKLIRLYRKLHNGTLKETTTIKWDPRPDTRTMWINSTYRQLNDYIVMDLTIPLDLWDYDYSDQNSMTTNMSIQFTGSHFIIWYNNYKICNVWLRDQSEDILYTTHVKLEEGFYFPEDDKAGEIYWYYGDESIWCWINCSQRYVFNFSGYYDEVLSPRTDQYQIYQERDESNITKPAFCIYYNCTRKYENYARCLMLNFTVYNNTSQEKETLLDLSCINDTFDRDKEIARAKKHWQLPLNNISNMTMSTWNQLVPDDPTGVGIVNGTYKCLQRDYCHDLRPFQLFNFEGGAQSLPCSMGLMASLLVVSLRVLYSI